MTPKHIHHHYAPSVTSTHMTHIISSTHHIVTPGFVDRPRRSECTAGQMDGEAGWCTTSGNIGLPPLVKYRSILTINIVSIYRYQIIYLWKIFENLVPNLIVPMVCAYSEHRRRSCVTLGYSAASRKALFVTNYFLKNLDNNRC